MFGAPFLVDGLTIAALFAGTVLGYNIQIGKFTRLFYNFLFLAINVHIGVSIYYV